MSDWWVLSDTDSGIWNADPRTLASTLTVNGTEATSGAHPKRLKPLGTLGTPHGDSDFLAGNPPLPMGNPLMGGWGGSAGGRQLAVQTNQALMPKSKFWRPTNKRPGIRKTRDYSKELTQGQCSAIGQRGITWA